MWYITNNYVNLREQPNTSSSIIRVLSPHTMIQGTLLEEWIKTNEGYVYYSYTNPVADYNDILPTWATKHQIELPVLFAVMQIETGKVGWTHLGPKIRNELHLFVRSVEKASYIRFDPDRKWLSHELYDGEWFNPHLNQEAEYRAKKVLSQHNEMATYASMSVGIGQIVLGLHYDKMGFKSPKIMHDFMRLSPNMDLHIWLMFLEKQPNLVQYMQRKDFLSFAKQYNGSGQAQHYANLMEQAYQSNKNTP